VCGARMYTPLLGEVLCKNTNKHNRQKDSHLREPHERPLKSCRFNENCALLITE
jgi:hypothetical protein